MPMPKKCPRCHLDDIHPKHDTCFHCVLLLSEKDEARRAKMLLSGEDVTAEPLWITPSIPTVVNAIIHLVPMFEISEGLITVQRARGRQWLATVEARCGLTNNSHVGAATSQWMAVAKLLAYRNGIRQHFT